MASSETPLHLYETRLREGKMVLRAINHPLRQKILHLIHAKGKITVSDLYKRLHLAQSAASQHLAVLRQMGFVNTERKERFIFYSVNYDRLKTVQQLSKQLVES